MYGAWITNEAEIIDVPEQCGHTQYKEYIEAHDEGWVCVVYGGDYSRKGIIETANMCIRLNPATVTKKALRKALRMISQSAVGTVYLSNMFTDSFRDHYGTDTKPAVMQLLRQEIAGNRCLHDNWTDEHSSMSEKGDS